MKQIPKSPIARSLHEFINRKTGERLETIVYLFCEEHAISLDEFRRTLREYMDSTSRGIIPNPPKFGDWEVGKCIRVVPVEQLI